MKTEILQYQKKTGWLPNTFPDLDSPNTLILVFAAPEFSEDPEALKELAKHYPKSQMLGCSSAGEILGANIFDHSLSVAIVKFEKTDIKAVKTIIDNTEDSFKAGTNIASQLLQEDLKAVFLLSEGLKVNGSELVKGVNEGLANKNIIVTGGLAGDGSEFKKTWAIFNGEICRKCIVAVGFYGPHIKVGHASRGGWDIFGIERRITRSKNNILYELDNQPALALYKEYLGEQAQNLPATGLLYPLAIRENEADQEKLVRTILAVDEAEQSLTFAGDMPMGYLAQLMQANFNRIIESASEAGTAAVSSVFAQKNTASPVLSIAISCVGRRLLLGERTEEETESVLEQLPKGSKQTGFYSYGELSPYAKGDCSLHNQTMTLTTLYES